MNQKTIARKRKKQRLHMETECSQLQYDLIITDSVIMHFGYVVRQ